MFEPTKPGRLDGLIERVGAAVALADDAEDERLRKAVMVASVYFICFGGVFWGAIYGALGLWVSASIPFAYSVLSLINIGVLYRTRRDRFFSISQLSLILVLPFLLQWTAGGFVPSGAVMLWAVLAPVGALMFHGIRESTLWFAVYMLFVVISGIADPSLETSTAQITPLQTASFFVSNVILVSSILFLVLRHFVAETERAKQQSDALVEHMLPAPVVHRLKAGEELIADRIDVASILFTDIVGFTELADDLDPEALVVLLNDLYGDFDLIVENLRMEKIRTVGDAYIAVAGLTNPHPDHALLAAKAALRMREALSAYRSPVSHRPIQMRFGIHCGPLVAGVLGLEKLNYEIWGDTVNVASRMESTSLPGEIQISEAVYQDLRGRFSFEQRGQVEVKGKGPMRTYLLGDPLLATPGA